MFHIIHTLLEAKMHTNGKSAKDHRKLDSMLKNALSEVSEKGKALFGEGLESARETLREKSQRIREKANELGEKSVTEIKDEVVEYIEQHPVKSVMIAAGVGFALAWILKPRRTTNAS
jgi:ElaB/YqjD/DUF883 family membrane-anchored ribosome-binding protein